MNRSICTPEEASNPVEPDEDDELPDTLPSGAPEFLIVFRQEEHLS